MVFCCAWFEILILLDVWFLSMTTFCLGFWWFRLWITMTYIGEVFCYVWAVLCCPVHPAGGLWSVLGVWMCNGSMESVKLMGMLFLPVAFPIHETGAPSLILYTRGTWCYSCSKNTCEPFSACPMTPDEEYIELYWVNQALELSTSRQLYGTTSSSAASFCGPLLLYKI